MELHATENTSIRSNYEQQGNGAFCLASKLLTEMLAGINEKIAVKTKAENIFYDPETKIQTVRSIKVLILSASLTESGSRTEISMSGLIESHGAVKCSFSLYFLLKRIVAVIPKKVIQLESLSGTSFVMGVDKSAENLHDSLFNLSISRVADDGKHFQLGEGRGFLVFGNVEAVIEN